MHAGHMHLPLPPRALISARQSRVKIGGAVDPAMSSVSVPVVATSTLSLRHHAWRAMMFHRVKKIDTAKSVSFEEEKTMLNLKLV